MPDKHEKACDDWRIPDEVWERLVPWLPPRQPHPLGGHRPRVDARQAMDAMFFVLRTGCPWDALDATGLCSHSAAPRRCQAWTEADGCVAVWAQGLVDYEALRGSDGTGLARDGAMTQAPLGGDKGGPDPDRPRPKRYQAPSPS
jgi:putative transposase